MTTMIKILKNPKKKNWSKIVQRPSSDFKSLQKSVKKILRKVQTDGDKALRKFTKEFDKVELKNIKVTDEELNAADTFITNELKEAIQLAKSNIEIFHRTLTEEIKYVETMPGVKCWRKSIGIEKVGFYIPGGTAPLFSTILMLSIPAIIAGCKEIVLCTPPSKDGSIHPAILYTAKLCGIKNIFKIGGAQAIGAMAYGTEAVPKVFKVFGPGNQYVTIAKQMLQQDGIAIDMPAGPSELLIIADESSNPEFVAADLLSQAEHGTDSQVILLTTSRSLIDKVQISLQGQLNELPRKSIAAKALSNSKIILFKDLDECINFSNLFAPEHLVLACSDPEILSAKIISAGSVFIGNYSPESAGDYASGTNHTLPTNGYAAMFSGVSVDSFVKKITFQELTKEGLENIGTSVMLMAEAEGLTAHKRSISIRIKN